MKNTIFILTMSFCLFLLSCEGIDSDYVSESLTPLKVSDINFKSGNKLVSISAGHRFVCVIDNEGNPYCWGENSEGQLGKGDFYYESSFPVTVSKITGFSIVSAGYSHTCGISDGIVYCWGDNYFGQLGNGASGVQDCPEDNKECENKDTPQKIGVNNNWEHVSSGGLHTCGISEGELFCWGQNQLGQLGTGDEEIKFEPEKIGERDDWVIVSSGGSHNCGIAGDELFCWGRNFHGQLGDGTRIDRFSPVPVDVSGVLKNKKITSISSGYSHTCVIDSDGKVYCWGRNNWRQLGEGSYSSSSIPVAVDDKGVLKNKKIISISSGSYHTCAVDKEGKAYCWGINNDGELGDGTGGDWESYSNIPVAVDTSGAIKGKKLVSISAGSSTTCALDSEGVAYCWGSNLYGELGIGD